jgi:hypothetical protein
MPDHEEIPLKWRKLARESVDSPFWRSTDGREYIYTMDKDWLVTNEQLGNKRIRYICKIVQEVVVDA